MEDSSVNSRRFLVAFRVDLIFMHAATQQWSAHRAVSGNSFLCRLGIFNSKLSLLVVVMELKSQNNGRDKEFNRIGTWAPHPVLTLEVGAFLWQQEPAKSLSPHNNLSIYSLMIVRWWLLMHFMSTHWTYFLADDLFLWVFFSSVKACFMT